MINMKTLIIFLCLLTIVFSERVRQNKNINMLSSPETEVEEEEVDDINTYFTETYFPEMVEGLIEALEEAKPEEGEEKDLNAQYQTLFDALIETLPDRIDLCRRALNEAYQVVYPVLGAQDCP